MSIFKFIFPTFRFKIEKWKWNKEYHIYVSNFGNFKNMYKQNLSMKINDSGYCMVKTEVGIKLAHRLVMLTWKPIPNAESLTVDHLNHNKRDNSIYNLEWVSREINQQRAKEDLVSNLQGYICTDNKKFNTYKQAVWWLTQQDKSNSLKTSTELKITNKIKKAIETNTLYCGKKWYIEDK